MAVQGMKLDPKWIAAILVAGYFLGKFITFYFGYRVVRFFWGRFRGRAATSTRDESAPLLADADGDIDGDRNGDDGVGEAIDSGQAIRCEVRVNGQDVVVTIVPTGDGKCELEGQVCTEDVDVGTAGDSYTPPPQDGA
ncbi:hypothetical protein PLESTM_001135100 [Pleodorina starrii]|nr:hypothetical protein PLESTM_001135100 [Pleodorina starrii]